MRDYPRKLRLNTQMRAELASLLRTELGDPRVQGVTVTDVDVSPDLRNARVRISQFGDDQQLADALAALNRAAGRLRHALGRRIQTRSVPQLRFVGDRQMREADRLNALIHEAVRRDQALHPDTPDAAGDQTSGGDPEDGREE